MGFFDKLKSFATSSKCKIGVHGGEWSQVAGEPECRLEKTCPDCDKHLTKTKHNYSDWEYIDDGSCESTRTCTYCGEVDEDVIHQYETIGENEDGEQLEVCSRCGEER